MAGHKITIKVVGIAKRVPVDDFLRALEGILAALERTEKSISGLDKSTIQFDVVNLHHSDPTVELEAYVVPRQRDYSGRTIQKFLGAVNELKRGRVPKWMDLEGLETFKEAAGAIGKNIEHVVVTNSKRSADITPQYRDKIDKIIGPDQYEIGSVTGRLEMLSIHQGNRFALYPRIAPKRVVCNFKAEQFAEIQGAMGRDVEAFGTLKFKARNKFPHEMDVEQIEVKPFRSSLHLMDVKAAADLATEEEPDDFMLALANDW